MPTRKTRAQIVIQSPSPSDIEEIARNLGLSANGKQRLERAVFRLVADIKRRAPKGDFDFVECRRRRKVALKKLITQLRSIMRALKEPEINALGEFIANDLAELLSTAAFERAIGDNIGDNVSFRTVDVIRRRPSTSVYRDLEAEVERMRADFASRQGIGVLDATLGTLLRRLERRLRVENREKGGAPADPLRRYILHSLIDLHNDLCHHHAWTKKRYVELAEQVLAVLGQPTDGLDQAVRRYFKAIGAKWHEPEPPPSMQ